MALEGILFGVTLVVTARVTHTCTFLSQLSRILKQHSGSLQRAVRAYLQAGKMFPGMNPSAEAEPHTSFRRSPVTSFQRSPVTPSLHE